MIFEVFRELKQLCQNQAKQLFGNAALEAFKSIHKELTFTDLINKFPQLAGNLTNENQRIEADQLNIFCRKIYGIESFDLSELTSWLSSDQV